MLLHDLLASGKVVSQTVALWEWRIVYHGKPATDERGATLLGRRGACRQGCGPDKIGDKAALRRRP